MSENKKRRGRVQGGWAAPTNVRSDRNKPVASPAPAWTNKTVDQPSEKKFVFEEPEEEIRQKPIEKVISKPGVYDISTEPTGLARLRFFPEFIDQKEADEIFDNLYHDLPWRQRSDVKNGQTYLQPRLTAWYGDLPYSYSGVTHKANPEVMLEIEKLTSEKERDDEEKRRKKSEPTLLGCSLNLNTDVDVSALFPNMYKWTPTLQMLKDRLETVIGIRFNSMLANLYRDGHDSVAWHSDDETSLGPEPTIASLSFGDVRNFELRKKPPPDENGDYTYSQYVKLPLTHGSLLIMEGSTQEDWQHRIPREYHDRDARINLTFRVIFPM